MSTTLYDIPGVCVPSTYGQQVLLIFDWKFMQSLWSTLTLAETPITILFPNILTWVSLQGKNFAAHHHGLGVWRKHLWLQNSLLQHGRIFLKPDNNKNTIRLLHMNLSMFRLTCKIQLPFTFLPIESTLLQIIWAWFQFTKTDKKKKMMYATFLLGSKSINTARF